MNLPYTFLFFYFFLSFYYQETKQKRKLHILGETKKD